MILYVEGSLCMETGAAGWGCILEHGTARFAAGGAMSANFGGAVTLMELCAVRESVLSLSRFADPFMDDGQLTIAMRSTAAIAVLRWVFPDAPFTGAALVEPPKRLGKAMKDAQCLYDLHDDVERMGLRISLQHISEREQTVMAAGAARLHMDRSRSLGA